jgi:predicted S18 family serine protease
MPGSRNRSGRCLTCRRIKDRRWYRNNSLLKIARTNAYKATTRGQIAQARSHVKQDIERKQGIIAHRERELQCL